MIGLPATLMPCLSSSADSDLNESIRVSNAESQLALPFRTTTVFGSSVICSPNGSAVCTGAAGCRAGADRRSIRRTDHAGTEDGRGPEGQRQLGLGIRYPDRLVQVAVGAARQARHQGR